MVVAIGVGAGRLDWIMGMRANAASAHRNLFRDEQGFTTTSMVLSLLITLALVFTAAQVYRINSASAEVQNVADAAALAAENQVAEFMIVARFCDATVLSLSLSGITACGLGIAALCTPPTATLSKGLIDAGVKMLRARDQFADRARKALDKLQEALPFFSAACAAAVAQANNADSAGSRYLGIALLVPDEAESTSLETGNAAGDLVDDIEEDADEIREKAKEAEEAAKEANDAKKKAFMRDCGDNPDYCMYERASHLAGLSGTRNPLYSSVDTWSFSVALERAKRYYSDRASNETPTGNTTGDQVRYQLRIDFYEFAADLLKNEGYVHEGDDSFDANFPHLPKNTTEMRETRLYTAQIYPITEEPDGKDKTKQVMHAWPGCPGATGSTVGHGSISHMESEGLSTCSECGFTAASMGKVASASTSIKNGFEYHYEAVAKQAEVYEKAIQKAKPAKDEVKTKVDSLLDELKEAIKEAVEKRLEVRPPGMYGAVAFVVNSGSTSSAGGFASGFAVSGSLGPRAAVSAATLVDEGSDEGRTVINSMLDGLRQNGGAAVGAAGIALDVWSRLLSAYSKGADALTGGVESGLNSIPLAGASGLGTWAGKKLKGVIKGIGLEPAKLEALKPVLVNSAHVESKDDGALSSNMLAVKKRVVAHPLYSTDLFSSFLDDAEKAAMGKVSGLEDTIEIASIKLLGKSGPTIPITIPIPAEAKQFGVGAIQGFFDQVRAFYAKTTGIRVWE